MILGHAVFGQQGTHLRVVAALPDLIDPARAEAKLGRHEQQVLHRGGAIDKGVMLIALVKDNNVDRRAVEIVFRGRGYLLRQPRGPAQEIFRRYTLR